MRPFTDAQRRKEQWRDLMHDLRPSRQQLKLLLTLLPWLPFIVVFLLVARFPYHRFKD